MPVNDVPHTEGERQAMLAALGLHSVDELFGDVPAGMRYPALRLPPPAAELALRREMHALAARNRPIEPARCFLGAGTYQHFRPACVDYVLSRGEFQTAYTPYQAEASQGMLQALFEYQSMICRLTDMEVSNASHYNGATALAEAVLLALNATVDERHRIVLSPTVDPQYRAVVATYLQDSAASMVVGDLDAHADVAALPKLLDKETAAVVVQYPDFFGQWQSLAALAEAVHEAGALLIVVCDALALGLLRAPGSDGADIVVADGQTLGLPPAFGGPHLGMLATRMAHVRRLPGHLVGATCDVAGRRGYVLTLATREQHIRRAKATSNICTNSALGALAAAVYLASMGKHGLREVAEACYHKSHYAAAEIGKRTGFFINPQAPDRPFLKEFVVRLPSPVAEVNAALLDRHGIVGGYDLGQDFPPLAGHMLVAVTEIHTRADIESFVAALAECAA